MTTTENECVFCLPNWPNLDIVGRIGEDHIAIVRPLNPVTDGHVLVIAAEHEDNAAASYWAPLQAAPLMQYAAEYVRGQHLQANIITSIGTAATQTVFHTHLHVVPRRKDDGLLLPWSPTVEQCGAGDADADEPDGWFDTADVPTVDIRSMPMATRPGRALFFRRSTPWVREDQR